MAIAIVLVAGSALAVSLVMLAQAMLASGRPLLGDWQNYHDAVRRVLTGATLYEPMQLSSPTRCRTRPTPATPTCRGRSRG